jgi:hypothetical protein
VSRGEEDDKKSNCAAGRSTETGILESSREAAWKASTAVLQVVNRGKDMAVSAYMGNLAQLGSDQLALRRLDNVCSTSAATCCSNAASGRVPRSAGGNSSFFGQGSNLRSGRFQTSSHESPVGLFRSAREQQRVESTKVRCLLRGVGDSFWDGSEKRIPGGYPFTGRMPYRSVSCHSDRPHGAVLRSPCGFWIQNLNTRFPGFSFLHACFQSDFVGSGCTICGT